MSGPKRPFTTSSLTSTLKSTLANQPLLGNLTNIDKLSSQASSLAQKAPFFGAINQQFQQHLNPQHNNDEAHQQAHTTTRPSSSTATTTTTTTTKGDGAPPAVDLSHLTAEERAMIESVMAKAEMADMGIPVDTSKPSSTNLPSNTSQALTEARHQQQQEQMQRQQEIMRQQQQQQQQQQELERQRQMEMERQQQQQQQQLELERQQQEQQMRIQQEQQQQLMQQQQEQERLRQQQLQQEQLQQQQQLQMQQKLQEQQQLQQQQQQQQQQVTMANQQQVDFNQQPLDQFNQMGGAPAQQLVDPFGNAGQTMQTIGNNYAPQIEPAMQIVPANNQQMGCFVQYPPSQAQPQIVQMAPQVQPPRPSYARAVMSDLEESYSDLDMRAANGLPARRAGRRAHRGQSSSMDRYDSAETDDWPASSRPRRDQRALQAYDLAAQQRQTSSTSQRGRRAAGPRQLPQQPSVGSPQQPAVSQALRRSRQVESRGSSRAETPTSSATNLSNGGGPKNARASVRPDSTKVNSAGSASKKQVASRQQVDKKEPRTRVQPAATSSLYLTDSDLDVDEDDTLSATDSIERVQEAAKVKEEAEAASASQAKQEEAQEERTARQLLSELKLSEQANQVMEQQQLLIKQSQELIKLQQAQLEQQVEIKRSLKSEASTAREATLALTRSESAEVAQRDDSDKPKASVASQVDNQDSDEQLSAASHRRPRALQAASAATPTAINSRTIGTTPSAVSKATATPTARARHQRADMFQSPTDTTDSDADFLLSSASASQRRRQLARKSPASGGSSATSAAGGQTKATGPPKAPIRRREPTGLPPSPLPVAAAIQLHHMQQQHQLRQQRQNAAAAVLRSRSVTSSPTHHLLDHLSLRLGGASGYLTDTGSHNHLATMRPSSPGTMSEYGGGALPALNRRRKRLPEPPTNVVPLKPSMVRKLIAAQRVALAAGSAPAAGVSPQVAYHRSLTSFDRPADYRLDLATSGSRTNLRVWPAPLVEQRREFARSLTRFSPPPPPQLDSISSTATRADAILDVKETPELDKLISNLDEFYGLESRSNHQQTSQNNSFNNNNNAASTSPLRQLTSQVYMPSTLSYTPPPLMSSGGNYEPTTTTTTTTTDARRNSEGQRHYFPSSAYSPTPPPRPHLASDNFDSYYPSAAATTTTTTTYDPVTGYLRSPRAPSPRRDYQHVNSSGGNSNSTLPYSMYTSQPRAAATEHYQVGYGNSYAPQRYRSLGASMDSASGPMHGLQSQRRAPLQQQQQQHYGSYVMDSALSRSSPTATRDFQLQQQQQQQPTTSYAHDRFAPASSMAPPPALTKDDIINNGPKFNSIGYRFNTENQNKYVTEPRTPIECLQSRYPYPYKRILLSKNPKDRIGNGIGVRILGGQQMPNVYDQVNRCVVTSGAFVTEVFQSSRVYFLNEMHEGDQIIEWNGVNLCNRSDEEVQQILFSQFSDDEVEIVYLNREKFSQAYGSSAASRILVNQSQNYHDYQHANPFGDSSSSLVKQGGEYYAYQTATPIEANKRSSIRRKLSLSSISQMWSR